MSFISFGEHQQIIRRFHLLLSNCAIDPNANHADEEIKSIKIDIDKLEQLVNTYSETRSKLKNLAAQYKSVLKQTRVNIRRQQIKKSNARVSR